MVTKIQPQTYNFYHIYNRGVDKRVIFEDNSDYIRFIHLLYVCNDSEIKLKNTTRFLKNTHEQGQPLLIQREGERLVEIICYCLMPNHYHLALKQLIKDGIPRFMHKLATAYTMAFNIKHERSGRLFEGPYKLRFINSENYLLYLSKYIHLNPIKFLEPQWKERGIQNWRLVNNFLESFRWSSYLDYIGIKNFPSIINKRVMSEFYKTPEVYKDFINQYLITDFQYIIL
ncbi:transposase [Patescibacteria group bacterium]